LFGVEKEGDKRKEEEESYNGSWFVVSITREEKEKKKEMEKRKRDKEREMSKVILFRATRAVRGCC